MSSTEITIIDPKEYGLEEKNVKDIQEAFTPKIVERDELSKIYADVIVKELDEDLCLEARELRLKLVKVRTGIAAVHKTQKEYFLSAGRYVDAWKNKETEPVLQMEEKLMEIEKYYERIEEEKKKQIQKDRAEELSQYVEDAGERDLSSMDEDVWQALLSAKKKAWEDLKAAEAKAEEERKEKERKRQLAQERRETVIKYSDFIDKFDDIDFEEISDDEFNKIKDSAIKAKEDYDAEQERVRKENERLQKENEEKDRIATLHADRREILDPVWDYLSDAMKKEKFGEITEDSFKDIQSFGLKKKADADDAAAKKKAAEEKERQEKEAAAAKAKKEAEEKAEKAQAELKARQDAEKKAEEDRKAKIQADLQKDDSAKIADLTSDLESLKSKYEFKSESSKGMYTEVGSMIDEIIQFIEKQ